LIPLYIAFLAWDEFIATHDQDSLAGAPQVPGENDQEADSEKVTGIAFKIAHDLVKEASTSIDEDEFAHIKTQIGEFAGELSVKSTLFVEI
jgi:amyloid beta precursor protein binding protein 1